MARKSTDRQKAFSYLRVSGKGQIDGDGFPRQQEAIAKFAKHSKIEVVDEFRDEGVSGTNELEDRDGLSSLLERIAGNGVRIVIVEDAKRLARDLMIQETILNKFRQLGVTVLGADGTDLTVADNDPTRVLIRQILGAVAQFDKSVIVARLKAARTRIRKESGRCEGAKPFGELPGEAACLARMKDLHRKPKLGDRISLQRIADTLNSEFFRNRRGGEWTKQAVYQALRS